MSLPKTSLAVFVLASLGFNSASADIATQCKAVKKGTKCVFSGTGSNLTSLLNQALKNYPNNLTMVINNSNTLSPITISNANNITINLAANVTLTAPQRTDSSWKNQDALITVENSNNFVLKGKNATTSIIDGQGSTWWNKVSTRPVLLEIDGTSGITIKSIQLLNSPKYNVHLVSSNTININNIAVNAPADSPNTDGINSHNITNMTIDAIVVNNGDDGIAVNSDNGPSSDIQISNVTLINGHGLSIGSQVYNPVFNMTVNNVTMQNAQYGLRIKTRCPGEDPTKCPQTKSGSVSNLSYENVTMTGVHYPIYFDLNYGSDKYSYVNLSNITYNNVVATKSVHPASLICSANNGCTNLVFGSVNIDTNGSCQGINGGSYNKVVPCSFNH
ncbi:Endo-polygalacturonase precursor [Legionella massiliensis]|uniref:Endo-polygalacturonase n=1 Tax=Legionella massiliensis TaxID=1034943 RepID=A0A078KYU5_9GAMM|nr:glycosyl hydrolase family 28 protein [Legionella massiliensis]CDZ78237.1 Endo-polygalacturonase precursor [Legionella massiliensis]CEE13975.1 Endo-polygalacturonase precursor [Legionella massiliensis]